MSTTPKKSPTENLTIMAKEIDKKQYANDTVTAWKGIKTLTNK